VLAVVVALAHRREYWVGSATLGLSLALGMLAVSGARVRAPDGLTDGKKWVVTARVTGLGERGWGAVAIPIALEHVARDGIARRAHGKVMLRVQGEPRELLLPGDRVWFRSVLRAPRGFLNPGAPDADRRAAARGVMAQASVHEPAALKRLGVAPSLAERLLRPVGRWRERMRLQAARLPGDGGPLVEAMVLGDRGDVDRTLEAQFRAAGVSHVLSVSGLHLAIAALLFYAGVVRLLLRFPRLGRGRPVRRVAALMALPATLLYTVLTGSQVATLRAFVVAAVWLSAVALGRRVSAAQALAVAAIVLLLASPLELFDPSFQLSFGAALGTALLAPRWYPDGQGGSLAARLWRWCLRLLAASAAALIATLPIAAWHFSEVAPAGLIANLVVIPLAELVLVPLGLCGCALAACGVPGGQGVLLAAGFTAQVTADLVRACASIAPVWYIATPPLPAMLAWYAAAVALAAQVRRVWRVCLPCVLLVAGVLGAQELARRYSSSLRVTFVDVGQGDAALLELPRGRVVLIDGGGSFDAAWDPGEQVLAPLLRRRGIRRIDLMVLSHPHPDHANGLGFLAERFPVGEIWENGHPTRQPGTVRLRHAAWERGVPIGPPRPLAIAGVSFESLGSCDHSWSENDNSLVLRVGYAGRSLLFPGDAEADAEAALVARGGLHADVLKAPHHGSRTSSSAALLAAVSPSLAVASCGFQNRFGHPHAITLSRYAAAGVPLLRTDERGAVTVTVRQNGRLDVETIR
jgi:competence protein ComEC